MATGTLAPQFYFTALSDAGLILPGALIDFYASGTSTRIPAYSDAGLTIPLANPAVADSAGRLVAYLSATSYKVVVRTAAGVVVKSVDPVQSVSTGATATMAGSTLGQVFVFGGDATSPITATSYPAGTTIDKTHAGTAVFNIDSANLAAGTYKVESMAMADVGTVTVAIVDLSSGSPDTPLATGTSTSTTGERIQTGAVTFPAPGAPKDLAIKAKVSSGNGWLWQIKLVRTA